jgi:hypothetical protein
LSWKVSLRHFRVTMCYVLRTSDSRQYTPYTKISFLCPFNRNVNSVIATRNFERQRFFRTTEYIFELLCCGFWHYTYRKIPEFRRTTLPPSLPRRMESAPSNTASQSTTSWTSSSWKPRISQQRITCSDSAETGCSYMQHTLWSLKLGHCSAHNVTRNSNTNTRSLSLAVYALSFPLPMLFQSLLESILSSLCVT